MAVLAAGPALANPRGVIVIMADDNGVNWSRDIPTPNVDRLAREGQRFLNAYAYQECSPTRAALVTSRYPAAWGHTDNSSGGRPPMAIPAGIPTWPTKLQEEDIATAIVGKWHINGRTPWEAGFDSAPLWLLDGACAYYGCTELRRDHGAPGPVPGNITDAFADAAVGWIRQQEGRFFLYLTPTAVHEAENMPPWSQVVRELDDLVGRVVAAAPPDTLIIFTGDNGCDIAKRPECSNAPLSGGKRFYREGGIRVPLTMTGPGLEPGIRPERITVRDIGQTVLDFFDLPPMTGVRGRSLFGEIPDRPLVFGGRADCMVVLGDWKIGPDCRLYNIVTDPGERQPQLNPPKLAELRERRAAIVRDWR